MSRQLYELVQFEKSVRKMEKDHLKSLRKTAKKARKNGDDRLPVEEARQELDQAFELLSMHIDTAAGREFGDQQATVDLEVDGEVILNDVSPRLLVRIRKPLKRLRKATRQLERLHPDPEISALTARTRRLVRAIDRAIEKANLLEVAERPVATSLLAYLRGGVSVE